MHWADFCLIAFESLNKVRGYQANQHFKLTELHARNTLVLFNKYKSKRDNQMMSVNQKIFKEYTIILLYVLNNSNIEALSTNITFTLRLTLMIEKKV